MLQQAFIYYIPGFALSFYCSYSVKVRPTNPHILNQFCQGNIFGTSIWTYSFMCSCYMRKSQNSTATTQSLIPMHMFNWKQCSPKREGWDGSGMRIYFSFQFLAVLVLLVSTNSDFCVSILFFCGDSNFRKQYKAPLISAL